MVYSVAAPQLAGGVCRLLRGRLPAGLPGDGLLRPQVQETASQPGSPAQSGEGRAGGDSLVNIITWRYSPYQLRNERCKNFCLVTSLHQLAFTFELNICNQNCLKYSFKRW